MNVPGSIVTSCHNHILSLVAGVLLWLKAVSPVLSAQVVKERQEEVAKEQGLEKVWEVKKTINKTNGKVQVWLGYRWLGSDDMWELNKALQNKFTDSLLSVRIWLFDVNNLWAILVPVKSKHWNKRVLNNISNITSLLSGGSWVTIIHQYVMQDASCHNWRARKKEVWKRER